MARTKTPKAIYGSPDRPLKIGDHEIQCYVLEDETRVLVREQLTKSLGMSVGGGKTGLHRLGDFVSGNRMKPVISKELAERIQSPIKFRVPRGGIGYGYEAIILREICDAVLEARKQGLLMRQQQHIADRCEDLMRGFAIVGIIALVDEATGYQEVRNRDALHQILEAYISPELLPWAKRFPEEFYKEIFRLNGWDYNPMTVKRPGVIGAWTNTYIYKQLPDGVLEELKKQTPKDAKGRRKHQYHRLLTANIGNPHLERQLAAVLPIMRLSTNWRKFKENFARAFKTGQQTLGLDENEE